MSIPRPPLAAGKTVLPLVLANADSARFECTYGRGCEGNCCSNSTPPVDEDKLALIRTILPQVLTKMRPGARELVEREGFIDQGEIHDGKPAIRVEADWCVFFNKGCVLHGFGANEGDTAKYKPVACYLFPIDHDSQGRWYVRQHGVDDEQWTELPCLAGTPDMPLAVTTLGFEMEMAARQDAKLAALEDRGSVEREKRPWPALP